MRTLFGMLVMVAFTGAANAHDCQEVGNAFVCPVPAESKIKCYGPVDDALLCNKPIGEPVNNVVVTKPSNCGVNRKGKYICW